MQPIKSADAEHREDACRKFTLLRLSKNPRRLPAAIPPDGVRDDLRCNLPGVIGAGMEADRRSEAPEPAHSSKGWARCASKPPRRDTNRVHESLAVQIGLLGNG